MPAPDLATFKPKTASDLLTGMTGAAAGAALGAWGELKTTIATELKTLSVNAFATQKRLAAQEIDQKEADFLVHMQELYFHQVLLHAKFLVYAAVQAVLDAVFGVIVAAIRNLTGIQLDYGKN